MNFLPHKVKLIKPKKKRSKKDKREWPLKLVYTVIAMEVEHMGISKAPLHPEDAMAEALADSDGYGQTHDAYEIELDDEDQEAIDAIRARARKKQSANQNVRTWLLIVNPSSGQYRWVTTEDVKFSSLI